MKIVNVLRKKTDFDEAHTLKERGITLKLVHLDATQIKIYKLMLWKKRWFLQVKSLCTFYQLFYKYFHHIFI